MDRDTEQDLEEMVASEYPPGKYLMDHITLYMDEHVQITLAEGLRLRGEGEDLR